VAIGSPPRESPILAKVGFSFRKRHPIERHFGAGVCSVEHEGVVHELRGKIRTVQGDRYAGEWPPEQFNRNGIAYEPSELTRSEIYGELLPLLNSRVVALLENDRLQRQLLSLERRTSRGGRDAIDHPRVGRDDLANAVAGALVMAQKVPSVAVTKRGPINYPPSWGAVA
jgi:hypothetical protein